MTESLRDPWAQIILAVNAVLKTAPIDITDDEVFHLVMADHARAHWNPAQVNTIIAQMLGS